ncbi:hybrid sensor histidine kinase/response regulator [Salinibius halmophilus]|uniref:hybrid sensor histidine kinase/response regulator n=1 Tax=Salinibius halmophilus TaxID=1853216 RepID=UPI000E6733FE|nr:ATP-binding protein [Salinibius halmophilus]
MAQHKQGELSNSLHKKLSWTLTASASVLGVSLLTLQLMWGTPFQQTPQFAEKVTNIRSELIKIRLDLDASSKWQAPPSNQVRLNINELRRKIFEFTQSIDNNDVILIQASLSHFEKEADLILSGNIAASRMLAGNALVLLEEHIDAVIAKEMSDAAERLQRHNWITYILAISWMVNLLTLMAVIIHDRVKVKRHAAKLDIQVNERTKELTELVDALLLQRQELLQARRQAEAASEAKAEFLATMSHEIRTPLNGVIGMTELLSRLDLSNAQKEYVEGIRNSGDTLMAIINDILDFSRIESGMFELEHIPFDLLNALEYGPILLSPKAKEKGLRLSLVISPDVPETVQGDSTRLKQVIVNLLGNAVKFTNHGKVTLYADYHNDMLSIRVADTGIGIPEDRQSRLFQSFSQVDASTTRKFGGTGLGLAISQQLVNRMGGDGIKVTSEENKGSTFAFSIPLLMVPNQASQTEKTEFDNLTLLSDSRVLKESVQAIASRLGISFQGAGDPTLLRPSEHSALLVEGSDVIDAETIQAAKVQLQPKKVLFINNRFAPPSDEDSYLDEPIRISQIRQMLSTIEAPQPTSETDADLSALHGLSILVAEDNIVNQKILIRFLEKLGMHPTIAGNGKLAIEMFELHQPPLILMDMQMPEMDGLQATRLIRAYKDKRQPYIIALTANARQEDKQSCLDAGMDDFLAKPLRLSSLQEALKTWLMKKITCI